VPHSRPVGQSTRWPFCWPVCAAGRRRQMAGRLFVTYLFNSFKKHSTLLLINFSCCLLMHQVRCNLWQCHLLTFEPSPGICFIIIIIVICIVFFFLVGFFCEFSITLVISYYWNCTPQIVIMFCPSTCHLQRATCNLQPGNRQQWPWQLKRSTWNMLRFCNLVFTK